MRICFYAAVDDPLLFEHVEFYRQDIEILRELGHGVRLGRRPRDLRGRHDLLWAWWQTSGMPAVLAARARGIPSVLVTALSDRDHSASGMPSKGPVARGAGRLALRTADIVLATSEDTRKGLERYGARELWNAPLGVDTDVYAPGEGARDGGHVLCISHLTEDNVRRKRICDVVRAAGSIPGLRTVIVGRHGSGTDAVRAEIDRVGAGDRIELTGAVSAERKRELLRSASVYVQPTEYEAFGLAIAEAMACGTPVISNRVGNVPDLVGDTGVLLTPGAGPEELARAMAQMVGDPGRRELGLRARRRIEQRFSMDARRQIVKRALRSALEARTADGGAEPPPGA